MIYLNNPVCRQPSKIPGIRSIHDKSFVTQQTKPLNVMGKIKRVVKEISVKLDEKGCSLKSQQPVRSYNSTPKQSKLMRASKRCNSSITPENLVITQPRNKEDVYNMKEKKSTDWINKVSTKGFIKNRTSEEIKHREHACLAADYARKAKEFF
jgi:hypothetical protein